MVGGNKKSWFITIIFLLVLFGPLLGVILYSQEKYSKKQNDICKEDLEEVIDNDDISIPRYYEDSILIIQDYKIQYK